jgi:hypothetical protein
MDLLQGFERNYKETDGTNSNYFNNIDDRDLIIETGTLVLLMMFYLKHILTSSDHTDVKVSKKGEFD